MDLSLNWNTSLAEAEKVLHDFRTDPHQIENCIQFSQLLTQTIQNGGNVFTCGNGGSHCDAMHFAEELTGRYCKDRRPLGALALGDPSHQTCVGNDFGFNHIFSRQLEGLARKGDLLIGISTSGNSENVIMAIDVARKKGMKVVALLGKGGGKIKSLADIPIIVPANSSERVQEIHIKIIHTVIETMERQLFPEHYA